MKGICFTELLFHKVIEGTKTQTRRIMTEQPYIKNDWFVKDICGWDATHAVVERIKNSEPTVFEIQQLLKPKYKLNEVIYLKEPYIDVPPMDRVFYKYSPSDVQELIDMGFKVFLKDKVFWKNKLFMPGTAARYSIKITGVRAERLQDISENDCLKEGIEDSDCGGMKCVCFGLRRGLLFEELGSTPQDAYAALLNRITGKGTWEKNPWVWVYDFQLV